MDKICDNITIFNDEEEIYMRRLTFVPVVLMGVMLAAALPVSAETLTTADGVLSIEAPSDQWAEVADPNHWFVISVSTAASGSMQEMTTEIMSRLHMALKNKNTSRRNDLIIC